MVMSSQIAVGRDMGWIRPKGAAGTYLVCWHVLHEGTKLVRVIAHVIPIDIVT